jgi:cytochrome P450
MSRGDEAITGLAWDPTDRQFLEDPADYYRWLRDEAPVHRHVASGSFFLSRFEDVWEATADWRTYSSRSPVARLLHMASMDPPHHDRLRAIVSRFFSPRRIAELEPWLRALCGSLLEPLRQAPAFELVESFASVLPSRVIHRLVGVPEELAGEVREVALGIGAARDSTSLARWMEALEGLTRRIVIDGPAPETPGLLQELAAASGPDRPTVEELRGLCSNLVLAGTDTVANLIGNGVVLLSRHPEARAGLVREPDRIPRAIEEMLRFESPVQSLARRVTRDVKRHGVTIPEGSEVRLQWGAANRDEREFVDPDRFDPSRHIRRHLALGHGIHFCLGAGLARLEARVAFESLLSRWPRLQVDEASLERLPSLWVRAWRRVVVVAD